MAGQAQVSLDLAQLEGMDNGDRVLLAVNDLGLKRGVDLTPAHGHGMGPELTDRGEMYRVFHGPKLQALEVCGSLQGATGVGEVPEAVLKEGQAFYTGRFEAIQKITTDWAVQDLIHVSGSFEEKGQVHHAHVGAKIGDRTSSRHRQLDGADLEAFEQLAFPLAELASGIDLDDEFSLGAFLDQAGKLASTHIVGVVHGGDCGQLEPCFGLDLDTVYNSETKK